MVGALRVELSSAARRLLRERVTSVVIVLSLAGAASCVVVASSVLQRRVLSPLPYAEPDRLVLVFKDTPERFTPLTPEERGRVAGAGDVLRGVGAITFGEVELGAGHASRTVPAAYATGGFLTLLGRAPNVGRDLSPDDATRGPAAIVATAELADALGVAPGDHVAVDGKSTELVGTVGDGLELVMGPGTEVVLPLTPQTDSGASVGALTVARLQDGVTAAQAEQRLSAMLADREASGGRFWLHTFDDAYRGPRTRRLYRLLLFAAVLVLGAATVNVASLAWARAEERRGDVYLRAALGASPRAIALGFALEAVLLGLLASLVAFSISATVLDYLAERTAFSQMIRSFRPRFGAWQLATTLIAPSTCAVAAFLSSAVSLLRNRRMLRVSAWADASGSRRVRVARLLVGGQVLVAGALMPTSILLWQGVREVMRPVHGDYPADLVVLHGRLPRERLLAGPEPDVGNLVPALSTIPGVVVAAAATRPPRVAAPAVTFEIKGRPARSEAASVMGIGIAGDYFAAVGASLVRGQSLSMGIGSGPARVVINTSLARKFWGDARDPLGSLVVVQGQPAQVVGVVEDVLHDLGGGSAGTASPTVYYAMMAGEDGYFHLRAPDRIGVVRAARELLDRFGRPNASLITIEEMIDFFLGGLRTYTRALAAFCLVAVGIALAGVYSLLSLLGRSRRREFAVRRVLGDTPGGIAMRLARDLVLLETIALLAAVPLAFALVRSLERILETQTPEAGVGFALAATSIIVFSLMVGSTTVVRVVSLEPWQVLKWE